MDELFSQLVEYAGEDYDSSQEKLLQGLLNDALEEVRNTMFPFGFADESEMQTQEILAVRRYGGVIKRIAEYHYDKIGKEGLLGSTENGTYSYYENAGTPKSYLRNVIPIATFV